MEFDGWCASQNVNPYELQLDRFCNLVYFWAVQHMDEEHRARFDEDLFRPPLGTLVETGVWSPEATLAGFEAVAGPGMKTTRKAG
jgi:hypothetical protein